MSEPSERAVVERLARKVRAHHKACEANQELADAVRWCAEHEASISFLGAGWVFVRTGIPYMPYAQHADAATFIEAVAKLKEKHDGE